MPRRFEKKVCSHCGQEKAINERDWKTYQAGKRAGKPHPFCRLCENEISRKHKQAQRDAAKQPAKAATRKSRTRAAA